MGRPRKSVEAFLPRMRSENTETFRETGEQWTPAKPRARAQQNCWFSAVLRGPSQTLRPPKCYFLADHPPRGHVPSWNSWKHHKGGPRSLGSVVFLSRDHRVSTCGQSPPGTEGFPDAIAIVARFSGIAHVSHAPTTLGFQPPRTESKPWDLQLRFKEPRNSHSERKKWATLAVLPLSLPALAAGKLPRLSRSPKSWKSKKEVLHFSDWP